MQCAPSPRWMSAATCQPCGRHPSEACLDACLPRWRAGQCRFGANCNFAHGEEELRRLPPRGDAYGGGLGRGRGGFAGGGFDAGFGEQGFPQSRGPGVRALTARRSNSGHLALLLQRAVAGVTPRG